MKHLINELQEKYAENNLDFSKALKVWGEAKLTPNQIKQAVQQDCNMYITPTQAKELYRYSCGGGKFVVETPKGETVSNKKKELLKKLRKAKYIPFTPAVRACVEKVGSNRFRTKFGSVEWMIKMINGQPHLARIEKDTKDGEKKKASTLSKKAVTTDLGMGDEGLFPSPKNIEEIHPGLLTDEATPMSDIISGRAGNDEDEIIAYLMETYGMEEEDAEDLYYEALPYLTEQ